MGFVWIWLVNVGSSIWINVPLWYGTLIVGETMQMWRHGVYAKFLYLPHNFSGKEPKTYLKKIKQLKNASSPHERNYNYDKDYSNISHTNEIVDFRKLTSQFSKLPSSCANCWGEICSHCMPMERVAPH